MKNKKTESEPKKESVAVKKQRIVDCTNEINEILDKYGCDLQCYFIVHAGGNAPRIEVVSK